VSLIISKDNKGDTMLPSPIRTGVPKIDKLWEQLEGRAKKIAASNVGVIDSYKEAYRQILKETQEGGK